MTNSLQKKGYTILNAIVITAAIALASGQLTKTAPRPTLAFPVSLPSLSNLAPR